MKNNRFTFIAKEKPFLGMPTSGQEYYLKTMLSALKELGYKTRLLSEEELSSASLAKNSHIFLYYVSTQTIMKLRLNYPEANLHFQLFHLEDETWNRIRKMRWKVAVFLNWFLVDSLLVTSRSLENEILKLARDPEKVRRVDPYYSCDCSSFDNLDSNIERVAEKVRSGKKIKFLYLGRFNTKRLPIQNLVNTLRSYSVKYNDFELKIVSNSSNTSSFVKEFKNFRLEFVNKYLTEKEKCKLYRNSDFFLYLPKGNVAMNPPITVLEAIYHGTIPIATPPILNDLSIPEELVIGGPQEIPLVLKEIINEETEKKAKLYLSEFYHFYDRARYLNSLKNLKLIGEEK